MSGRNGQPFPGLSEGGDGDGDPGLEGVGPDRVQSDDQTQRDAGQKTVIPGVPDEKPDEVVSTVTAGETAYADHLEGCSMCFTLADGTQCLCVDGLKLRRTVFYVGETLL
jgi:hypothetical protein